MSTLSTENSAASNGGWGSLGLNFSSWHSQQFLAKADVSKYMPSLKDLALVGPRIVKKLSTFILTQDDDEAIPILSQSQLLADPNHPDNTVAAVATAAAATASVELHASSLPTMASTVFDAATSTTLNSLNDSQTPTGPVGRMASDSVRNLGTILSFAFSKWAISSVAMTILLNRTNVYACTRRPVRLSLLSRLIVRSPAIALLVYYAISILRALQCQTSPEFSRLRWSDPTQSSDLMFAFDLPALNWISSSLLLGASDRDSCIAAHMIPLEPGNSGKPFSLHGSLSLLWPVFMSICLSWFVECLSCSVEGRHVGTETGMSLLETSLAFSEAEGAISGQISWTKQNPIKPSVTGTTGLVLTRSMILNRANASPEMLVVAFLTCMAHITSNLLAIFRLQSRYRLISTGVWASCFMAILICSWCSFSFDDIESQSLLRFPTVCLLSWVPHMMLFFGMVCCLGIYGLTVLLSSLSLDGNREYSTIASRASAAMENMQARISLAELRVTGQVDFYTALLRVGFAAVSLASEVVYLQEDKQVNIKPRTWLEQHRLESLGSPNTVLGRMSIVDLRYDDVGTVGLIPIERDPSLPVSVDNGYAHQRLAQSIKDSSYPEKRIRDSIGAAERRNKLLMAIDLLLSMLRLVGAVSALLALALFSSVGVTWRPRLLVQLSSNIKPRQTNDSAEGPGKQRSNGLKGLGGTIAGVRIPTSDDVDVEAEVRKGRAASIMNGEIDENDIDNRLYRWWVKGGIWGKTDTSGDYNPPIDEESEDHTSDISEDEDDDVTDNEGAPGASQTGLQRYRHSSPFSDTPIEASDLARLLHPQTLQDRENARTLSAHLASDTLVTRSRFRRIEQLQKSRILMPRQVQQRSVKWQSALDDEEEERLLEALLLSRRNKASGSVDDSSVGDHSSWSEGASGLGNSGPQCVVCQCAPRTIIVWPCRCLSLCDDCRVSLAMNNFDKCVCCRREVGSFSRIYVP
ncbi:Protein ASI1 [Ceratocystis lukuohia]|uniref:Protein ASI1 n=1 Tax=Ceratocystis lukuohia TaxID=2019550 RepID=A0ABR4MBN2_9PEZI